MPMSPTPIRSMPSSASSPASSIPPRAAPRQRARASRTRHGVPGPARPSTTIDDPGDRRRVQDAGIRNDEPRSRGPGEDRDRGAALGEVREHLRRHRPWIRTHALVPDTVIRGRDDDRRGQADRRGRGRGSSEPAGEGLQPAQAPGASSSRRAVERPRRRFRIGRRDRRDRLGERGAHANVGSSSGSAFPAITEVRGVGRLDERDVDAPEDVAVAPRQLVRRHDAEPDLVRHLDGGRLARGERRPRPRARSTISSSLAPDSIAFETQSERQSRITQASSWKPPDRLCRSSGSSIVDQSTGRSSPMTPDPLRHLLVARLGGRDHDHGTARGGGEPDGEGRLPLRAPPRSSVSAIRTRSPASPRSRCRRRASRSPSP